jgi:hypothetical protein
VTSSSESEPELLVPQPWDLHQFLIETRIEQERIMRPLLKLNGAMETLQRLGEKPCSLTP